MKTLTSRDNPLVKHLIKLSGSSRERRLSGTTVLDGEHLIQAFCAATSQPLELLVASESGLNRPSIAGLMESAPALKKFVIEDRLFGQASHVVSPSGILAVIATPISPALPARIGNGLYLEGIQDPGNLGSIFRTALGAGCRAIYMSGGSVFAWSPKVIRAGMGAHFHLAIHENVGLEELSQRADAKIIATQSGEGTSIYETDLRGPVIWMFGNEGAGLSGDARKIAGLNLTIPMAGQTESLNVAASVAICLFEQARQLRSVRGQDRS